MRVALQSAAITLCLGLIASVAARADDVIERVAMTDAPSGRAAPTQSSTGPHLPRRVATNAAF